MSQTPPQRINKYLAQSGVCSRRKADDLIAQDQVTINGERALLGDLVKPGDLVKVAGQPVFEETEKIFLLFHKPFGVICTADPKANNNIFEYLPNDLRLIQVGRLDVESSGLMLLTNDGEAANKIMHPSSNHEKEYLVEVTATITSDFIRKMEDGVILDGSKTKPCKLGKINDHTFSMVLTEGRNRQIRHMCEALGYEVSKLKRERILNLTLGKLKPGEYRELKKTEIYLLLKGLE
ncbi:MAG: Pseudouridine synthase [Candidatus Uhrbacteria bacterium GW2011_GWE2_45_35]|nr:MAG: Pseudouridine synthase [Candidatus Uhrbacteria bacterium GW2011_GWE2_45_35]HBR80366.1 23S rRNA pseudouridine synthase F [Candidatus Uhrbacteria bacterium]HCU32126.1 23S rRNA pseudouridine synthase F [Candidatus Uhrbacteria bacterium]